MFGTEQVPRLCWLYEIARTFPSMRYRSRQHIDRHLTIKSDTGRVTGKPQGISAYGASASAN